MKDLYLTSTFTNQWNVEFNSKIGTALEEKGIVCYLPHRDTDQKGTNAEKFNKDIKAIKNSSIVLAVALNESPNWGAEVGYAYGINKPILALTNQGHAIPIICEGTVTKTFRVDDLDQIESYIDALVQKIKDLV